MQLTILRLKQEKITTVHSELIPCMLNVAPGGYFINSKTLSFYKIIDEE